MLARYALSTHLPPEAVARLRIMPSNPSSFPYLDDRRYNYTFVDGRCELGELRVPDADAIAACPGFDQWRYGIGGLLPPYVEEGLARPDGGVRRFPAMAVTYVQGAADVCNEDGACGTDSHGP